MNQKIKCHAGQCYEDESLNTAFEELFDDSNVVDQIQKDLWRSLIW